MVKGFSPLTRVSSKRQGVYAHAIVHSPKYIEGVGKKKAKREHDFLVKHYLKSHHSPFK